MEKTRRTALITGGTRGIGYGCAEQLALEGYNLAINGVREEEQVAAVVGQLRDVGVEVIYCRGDVASGADRHAILNKINDRFGCLHVLVNNAGIAPRERRDILETTEESFSEVLGINLKGPYFLTQAVANWMIEQKESEADFRGCIINISSISAATASVNRGEYCISKAGISMASKLFAVRLGEFGIPVYEVRPGIIQTDMTAGVVEMYDKLIADGLCVTRRWGLPEDVGRVAAALSSGRFAYSTGQVIMVDGGLTVPRL